MHLTPHTILKVPTGTSALEQSWRCMHDKQTKLPSMHAHKGSYWVVVWNRGLTASIANCILCILCCLLDLTRSVRHVKG